MHTITKILPLLILLNTFYAHSMKMELANNPSVAHSKDPRLLLNLPDELLGKIIRFATNYIDGSIKQLVQISGICKAFQDFSKPEKIKIILCPIQDELDSYLQQECMGKKPCIHFATLLMDMGAANAPGKKEICLISNIIFDETEELAKLFITHRININYQDHSGMTALHHATRLDKSIVAKMLLDKNADMYLKDNYGQSSAYNALMHEKFKCVKLLIEHGLDTSIEYNMGNNRKFTFFDFVNTWDNNEEAAEIYKLVTDKEKPKSWYEKSTGELIWETVSDTCTIS